MASPDSSSSPARPAADLQTLDALTGGAFSAATSGERATRVRAWLASDPPAEQISEVFKLLSHRDKGAAKPLREKLDEVRRAREQDAVAADWAAKAQHLLQLPRLNVADALAWQRDAAKAGAPLSREPLATWKNQLAERVRVIEDLQHRTQVQREAAVLISQRIEVLSTKPWKDGQSAWQGLRSDVSAWQGQAEALKQDPIWPSVDPRFAPQLEAARVQLLAVWDAFEAALRQALVASEDPSAPLPAVPVWAEELRLGRGEAPAADKPVRPKVDPAVAAQQRSAAAAALGAVLDVLKKELAEGHGKSTPKAAADVRQALKEHGRHLEASLESEAQAALAAAGELEGWQRWRADQIREELVAKAQALASQPLGGRKQQETLRALREQWKTSDQGGAPNHAMWKRFDEACNQAYKVVEAWLEKTREQQEANKAQRRALMDELRAWTEAHQQDTDWRLHIRSLHSFEQRWREAGHLSEKAFTEMNGQWKPLIDAAAAPLEAARQDSLARRRAMIEEAQALGAQASLRIDAVKALQQRWQQEAQQVPLERRQEQKLWDAFRKPIDEAFQRKSAEREKAAQALGEHDRLVMAAARALQEANASGDAQQIQVAAKALEAAVRGQARAHQAQAAANASAEVSSEPPAAQLAPAVDAAAPTETPAPKPAAPRPVIAVRGDDRPGAKKPEPALAGAGRDGRRDNRRDGRPERAGRAGEARFEGRRREDGERLHPAERGPRLGDAAFRAQREAMDQAQQTLRRLAAQAHGEVLSQLMSAWQQRDPALVPSAQALGKAVPAVVRSQWVQVLAAPASAEAAAQSLLRLEMAADLPTPAEHLSQRRMLQLELLTRRHEPSPAQTWAQDLARVFASAHDAAAARRVQNVLKVLWRS